jgi:hypothetical protein
MILAKSIISTAGHHSPLQQQYLAIGSQRQQTPGVHTHCTLWLVKETYPFWILTQKSLYTSYYYSIPGSSNAPATTFLQIAICHNRIADAPLARMVLHRPFQRQFQK